jgi:integrase
MPGKLKLTDRKVASDNNQAGDYRDALAPGMALRVRPSGHKSFVFHARFPSNPKVFTRRTIGEVGELTLEEAREEARRWMSLIKRSIDPQTEIARQRASAEAVRQELAKKRANNFKAVAEAFVREHVATHARARESAALIEKVFVSAWAETPIADLTLADIKLVIRSYAKRNPGASYKAYSHIRRLLNWAVEEGEYGITRSPLRDTSPKAVIGIDRIERQEVLKDRDLVKVWGAAVSMGAPFGALIQFLILTGQRLREAANMTWAEVDMGQKLWTIPASRMKSRQVQEVPLAPKALALLNELRSQPGFVFTTTGGKRPISGFSKYKTRLDLLSGVSGWRIHDLRRTMRTNISSLPVEEKVWELVIAHGKKGLSRVYDQHEYREEKARCLRLWEEKFAGITTPEPTAPAKAPSAERALKNSPDMP